ncbi:carbonic anhydrase [Actinoplanes sp. LDG1-06]|uniref:Carbonic anhydrase n=1 Tax=Paractinoplanes ovalisporus TaxID=2810368 RepID=A0ABS2AQG6_9ACTN|nr:carbonic anhydrase [Actinoplanes ovalisporus]MBM2622107.1 carbonic anhydrase [Actinoplanes ovalisporus]
MFTDQNTAWDRLLDGNRRWLEERSTAAGDRGAARRAALSQSQEPFALVVGCADSRVPAEILFDQGLGDLFVVRTAGHVVDAAVLGSVEYAVGMLGVSLIVVLGHEGCGAVAAAAGVVDNAQVPSGYVRDIAERIAPNVLRARLDGATTPSEVGAAHSLYTVDLLRERSSLIDRAVRGGKLQTVAAQYCLSTGEVAEVRTPARLAAAAA